MQYLLDNVSAATILLVMIVLLVVMQERAQRTSIERSAMYAAKKQTLEYADLLTRELSLLGATGDDAQRIDTVFVDANGNTERFRFWTSNAAGNAVQVEYVLEMADTMALNDTTSVPVYEVQRFENGVHRGGSMPTLDSFELELLDRCGDPVGTNYGAARQVRIQFSSVLPYGHPTTYYLPRTYWATTLRPPSLRLNGEGTCPGTGSGGSGGAGNGSGNGGGDGSGSGSGSGSDSGSGNGNGKGKGKG
jgi:hypothetical protein